nr:MAG TPA: hypothetical protein [Caudoviricetes sp.]
MIEFECETLSDVLRVRTFYDAKRMREEVNTGASNGKEKI